MFCTGHVNKTVTTVQRINAGWFIFDLEEAASDTRGQVSLFCAEPPLSLEPDRADIFCVSSLGAAFIIVSQRVLNSMG